MRRELFAFLCLLPCVAGAAEQEQYGVGILCPRSDTQAIFYTENNQQDAAGTISFQGQQGFTITSDSVRDMDSSGAQIMEGACEAGAPGIRIDAKRDNWLQAGKMWLPPNQEWSYMDWQELLHKATIWKAIVPVVLYQGTIDAPYKDKPFMGDPIEGKFEIYPIKILDDYALVVIDGTDAFTKSCAGQPLPPVGKLGWIRLTTDDGKPALVPVHLRGCTATP